jgi:hypothetical protein
MLEGQGCFKSGYLDGKASLEIIDFCQSPSKPKLYLYPNKELPKVLKKQYT